MPCERSIRCDILVLLLTESTFRLNCRGHIRNRSTAISPDNSYNLSSIWLESQSEANGSKSRQPGRAVTVHCSAASDFTPSTSHHSTEPSFDETKPACGLHLLATPMLILVFKGDTDRSEILGIHFSHKVDFV